MTILLYDHYELEERVSRHPKSWEAWHLVLYAFAAIFGIVNYVLLIETMKLVDGHCILHPRKLEFIKVELPVSIDTMNEGADNATNIDAQFINNTLTNETSVHGATTTTEAEIADDNATDLNGNVTHRDMLDTSRSLFADDTNCDFAEYMPILSTIFACVWATMFTICTGGGHAATRLQQPWRILTPALIFALVMVGLTGHSFTTTNGGLHDFCSAFHNVTNATTCSSVNQYLELGWNATWGLGGRVAATRAASAAVWASWACAAALLFARCLAAPDFQLRRTGVYLKDPQKKIIPLQKKSSRQKHRSNQSSPNKNDAASVNSEPTITTELVTASIEQGQDSMPTSLSATPVRRNREVMEMTYTAPELATFSKQN